MTEHGTVAGARRHQNRHEALCEACREAWALYYRERRQADDRN